MEHVPRIQIVTGHFGSGKTEISINLAIRAKEDHGMVAIADLDVINPYFRSREAVSQFDRLGIELIAPKGKLSTSDLPIVTGELYRVIHDPVYQVVIDVGGDKEGAAALGQFSNEIRKGSYQMLFVVNAHRPYVSTVDGITERIRQIEGVTRLKVTGLINNTHLGMETTDDHVRKGAELARQASVKLGIPFLYSTVSNHLQISMNALSGMGTVIPIQRYMRLPWE